MMNRVLIVRHAERPVIPPNEVGNELSITEEGVKATKGFGEILSTPLVSVKSSPVLRCLQTAEILAKTLNFDANLIEESKLLGDPGFFIEDGDLAWTNWQEKGAEAVNQYLLTGTEKWVGFHDFRLCVSKMCDELLKELQSHDKGLKIWVTHDTVLATLASRVLSEPLSITEWPNFLGYLEVSENNGELVFLYNSKNI